MHIRKEVWIVRWSIIVLLIATPIGLTIDYLLAMPEKNEKEIMSGFGKITIFDPKKPNPLDSSEIYQNDNLKFQVSKPKNLWEIHAASEYFDKEKLNSLKSIGYLDGIYVEKKENKQFLITVFRVQEDFKLKNYINEQIQKMKLQTKVEVPIKKISESNDWAIFSLDTKTNGKYSYGEQLLFLKEGQLYTLQYTGHPPKTLTESEKSDILFIMNSFEVII